MSKAVIAGAATAAVLPTWVAATVLAAWLGQDLRSTAWGWTLLAAAAASLASLLLAWPRIEQVGGNSTSWRASLLYAAPIVLPAFWLSIIREEGKKKRHEGEKQ